jgi:hypothetical protein
LTFTVLAEGGVGYAVFVWCADSDESCNALFASLISCQRNVLADALVRMTFQTCEHMYISPTWWDSLDPDVTRVLLDRLGNGANPFESFQPDELKDDGLRCATGKAGRIVLRATVGSEAKLLEEIL